MSSDFIRLLIEVNHALYPARKLQLTTILLTETELNPKRDESLNRHSLL